jgi:hypothetical protein
LSLNQGPVEFSFLYTRRSSLDEDRFATDICDVRTADFTEPRAVAKLTFGEAHSLTLVALRHRLRIALS